MPVLCVVMNKTPFTILKLVVVVVESEKPPTAVEGFVAKAIGSGRRGRRSRSIPMEFTILLVDDLVVNTGFYLGLVISSPPIGIRGKPDLGKWLWFSEWVSEEYAMLLTCDRRFISSICESSRPWMPWTSRY